MTNSTIKVEGMRELRAAFRKYGQEVDGKRATSRLTKAYKSVSEMIATRSQAKARSGTKLQAKMAGAIRPAATVSKGPTLRVAKTGRNQAAHAAFWGQKRRSGWFAADKYKAYDGQHQKLPEWVGAAWSVGKKGEGPYAINDTIADNTERIVLDLRSAIEAAAKDAGLI